MADSKKYDDINKIFDSSGYLEDGKVKVSDRYKTTYVDGSDGLANQKGLVISFQHVPTGRSVFFKAFITAFNEAFSSDWSSEPVYGRADPIHLFKNTTRRISLAFMVPASTVGEAYENLGKVQSLIQFLYPNYTTAGAAQTISQSPLVRLKVMNMLQTNKNQITEPGVNWGPKSSYYDNYKTSIDSSGGLLGAISSVIVNHHLDDPSAGVFYKSEVAGPGRGEASDLKDPWTGDAVASNTVLPKLIEINMEFMAIHEHPLGWDANGNFGSLNPDYGYGTVSQEIVAFPYGVELEDLVAQEARNDAFAANAAIEKELANVEGELRGMVWELGDVLADDMLGEMFLEEAAAETMARGQASMDTAFEALHDKRQQEELQAKMHAVVLGGTAGHGPLTEEGASREPMDITYGTGQDPGGTTWYEDF